MHSLQGGLGSAIEERAVPLQLLEHGSGARGPVFCAQAQLPIVHFELRASIDRVKNESFRVDHHRNI